MLEGFEQYEGREQTAVKHEVLKRYLTSFAHIVGFKWNSITYIDGFSGPWNAQTDDLSDTSFSIALRELRQAKATHAERGKQLRIRCVFVEKDRQAYQQLRDFADSVDDAEVHTIHGEFENTISEIVEFVLKGPDTFPFTLIDPTGPSGFGMKIIAPLLKLQPGEVLINFMLEFIRRMRGQENLEKCLAHLFGTDEYDQRILSSSGVDRDDMITEDYCKNLSVFCNYSYVLRALVMHHDKDRLYFPLVYATRSLKGVEVFKDTEAKAMKVQEKQRARAEQRKRTQGGQQSFLEYQEPPDSAYYDSLRIRYLDRARSIVASIQNENVIVKYDRLWLAALSLPLVWKNDLNKWLKEWRDEGKILWKGMKPREKTLKVGAGHMIERITDLPIE